MTEELNAQDVIIDVTPIEDDKTEEVIENTETPVEYINRNMFYANDALTPPPYNASEVDKKRYQQIKKSVKRLRKLEKNPIFIIKRLDEKQRSTEINDRTNY